jgi:AraC-like DNA-binding protein
LEWCNREVSRDSIVCFHPSGEFESLSSGGFAIYTLSFQETQLAAIAERLGYPGFFDELCMEKTVDSAGPDSLPDLRALLRGTFSDLDTGMIGTSSARALGIESRIAEALVMLLLERRSESHCETLRNRSRAVKVAISYILENAREAVTVADVCETAGVSWRTLNRAFEESIGASPKTCITSVRLRGARRELRKAEPTASVAEIANSWGFWHMGDFAMNYRREFRELPSETLRKQLG